MRALVYNLTDGTTVKTMAEAKSSGQQYKAEVIDIPKPVNVSPKQERICKGLFGGEF
jgi:hypothetical protein